MPNHILVVDDDPDIRDVLRLTLEDAGFVVEEADDGVTALDMIRRQAPHLVIVDYTMPRLDGAGVVRELKAHLLLRHLPVIMLTARGDITDKVSGLEAGADDYMVKPFEPEELLARVRMVLRRTAQELDANPLTKLPGNASIQHELEQRLAQRQPLAVLYCDLDQFKAFNDYYGFERGDQAIQRTATVLLDSVHAAGAPDDFIGHIGGDDFVVITAPERAQGIARAVVDTFDATAPSLYNEADRQRGHIVAKNRQGHTQEIRLLSISIGIVSSARQPLTHVAQIAELGAELKAYAKTFHTSAYVEERRQGSD